MKWNSPFVDHCVAIFLIFKETKFLCEFKYSKYIEANIFIISILFYFTLSCSLSLHLHVIPKEIEITCFYLLIRKCMENLNEIYSN